MIGFLLLHYLQKCKCKSVSGECCLLLCDHDTKVVAYHSQCQQLHGSMALFDSVASGSQVTGVTALTGFANGSMTIAQMLVHLTVLVKLVS